MVTIPTFSIDGAPEGGPLWTARQLSKLRAENAELKLELKRVRDALERAMVLHG